VQRSKNVNRLGGSRKLALVAVAALAIVLTVSLPTQARGTGGPGVGSGQPGGAVGHGSFDGHHGFDGHHFDHHRFGFAPVFPFYGYYPYYPYGYQAPAYWYYCPSSGAYYPDVQSCSEAWVPVPAS
jgi:hypothetical protein